ncbi:polysaccharide biosynthesis C-terminal domain-containing protein [Myroides marinus]|uniref:polysaccharide biosynthesis C-terminal domain-containing protein n=1 Tax=Myroides marinus TaxID=703342 RepID=UPI002578909D|nr:polysaccharide biosynthesis C-terminal domain-containing protein [Myroides marinus]MDM1376769.1 polysaccharide biosynthesis C-terminal domain-containing protein [Myroides marinus]
MASSSLKRAAVVSYSVLIINILTGLLYTPWMISKIGKDDYSLYILITSFLAYFTVDYGIWQTFNLLISKFRAGNNEEQIKKAISVSINAYIVLDIMVAISILFVYFHIETVFVGLPAAKLLVFKDIFLVSGIVAVFNFPLNFVKGVMYGYEYLVEYNYFEAISKLLSVVCTFIALSFDSSLIYLVLIFSLVPFVKNVLALSFIIQKDIKLKLRAWDSSMAKNALLTSIWLVVYVFAELMINNISPTIISIRSTIDQIAVFAIGLVIYGYVYQFSNAISGLFLPKLARMKIESTNEEINSFSYKISRIQILVCGFIISGVFVTGSLFIDAWVGATFKDSFFVSILLISPGIIIFSQQVEQSLLFANGMMKYRTILMVLTALCSSLLSVWLTPKYGALGTAFSIAISNFVFMALCMNIVYVRYLRFNQISFFKMLLRYISLFVLICFATKLLSSLLLQELELRKWGSFILTGCIYTVLYLLTLVLVILKKSERNTILIFLKNKIK